MRALLLITGVTLALCGCSRGGQTDNNQAVAESLTAQNIVSNDVTAIDAVTGDAANMAADVDMNFGNLNGVSGNESAVGAVLTRSSRPAARSSSNVVANTTANSSTNAATTNAE